MTGFAKTRHNDGRIAKNAALNLSVSVFLVKIYGKQKHLGCKKVRGQEANESATKSSDIR